MKLAIFVIALVGLAYTAPWVSDTTTLAESL